MTENEQRIAIIMAGTDEYTERELNRMSVTKLKQLVKKHGKGKAS